MSNEREQLEAGIAALEAQRTLLGDVVVEERLLEPVPDRSMALQVWCNDQLVELVLAPAPAAP